MIESTKVWLLVIEHKNGDDAFVCLTEQGAKNVLANYVRTWWDAEYWGINMPEDDADAIGIYFADYDGQEDFYTLTERVVLP